MYMEIPRIYFLQIRLIYIQLHVGSKNNYYRKSNFCGVCRGTSFNSIIGNIWLMILLAIINNVTTDIVVMDIIQFKLKAQAIDA